MGKKKYLAFTEEGSLLRTIVATPLMYGGLGWPILCFAAGLWSYGFLLACGGGFLGLLSGLPVFYFASQFCSVWQVYIDFDRCQITTGHSSNLFGVTSVTYTTLVQKVTLQKEENGKSKVRLLGHKGMDFWCPIYGDDAQVEQEAQNLANELNVPFEKAP